MLCARSRGDHHHGNPARRGALAQLHHQFVARHTGHFEVGNDQMAAVLGHQVCGFEPVRRQFHPVAVLLQHPADEFAYADGIVRHHDYTLLLNAVDGFGRNASACNRCRARSEDSCGAGASLYLPVLAWFCCYHAVQVNQQNEAAIGRDRRTRKEFYPAQVLPQVLDNDFVFTDNLLNNEADLPVTGICHHHAEVPADWFERRQAQIGIQPHHLGNHVAHLGQ